MIHIAIPARKGSKRLINKNKLLINDKPLVQYTFDFAKLALEKGLVDTASIISDDPYILELASKSSLDTSYTRPDDLSLDTTSTKDTLVHWINAKNIPTHDYILLLQPTSPFRFIDDLVRIKLTKLTVDQMIYGVVSLPGRPFDYFSDSKTFLPDTDKSTYFIDGSYYYTTVQRLLSDNGLAILNTDTFYVTACPFPIDIDVSRDLESLNLLNLGLFQS